MNKKILIIIFVAVIFTIIGFCIGKSCEIKQKVDYKQSYAQGWSYFFSDYGNNNQGAQYISYYSYGRDYNKSFKNARESFYAGWKDAFFYVNKNEPGVNRYSRIEKGYQEYYGDIDKTKIFYSSIRMIECSDSSVSESKSKLFTEYSKLIKSINDEMKGNYKNSNYEVIFEQEGSLIITIKSDKEDDIKDICNDIANVFIKKVKELYKVDVKIFY